LRHNIKFGNIQGIFAVLSVNLQNPFIPIFAIKVLHASDQQVAWLSSLPAITGILALIPGAVFLDRLQSKRLVTAATLFLARIMLFVICLLPLFPSNDLALWLIVMIALMNFPASVGGLFWQAFYGNVIPKLERSRVFANRNRIMTGLGLTATLATGIIIGLFPEDLAWPYQLFFLLAFMAGMLEVYYTYRMHEPARSMAGKIAKEKLVDLLRKVVREKKFIYFLMASLLFHFGWQMAWPLFNIYQIDQRYVNMNAFWLSIMNVVNNIAQMSAFAWWGRKAKRYGNGAVLVVSGIGMALNPYLYMLTNNAWAVIAINAVIGLFVAGFIQTLFNRQLDLIPEDHRTFFLAIHSVSVGISGIFAPMFGVWLYHATTMNTGFFVSGTIRMLGAMAFGAVALWELKQMRRESRGVSA
jgi:MFS family permease